MRVALKLSILALLVPSPALAADGADWLPLRDVKGGTIKVGCTWGPTSCGGYHATSEKAIDFLVPVGTPVLAAGSGTIVELGSGCAPNSAGCKGGRGNYITIEHSPARFSRYLHLSKFSTGIKVGVKVKAGQLIAYSGNSGQNEADHLHYDELTTPATGKGKLDPGPLIACRGSSRKTYSNWPSFAYKTTIRSDGYEFGCAKGTISIYALANSRYVAAELMETGNRVGMLRARSKSIGTWEKFAVVGNCRGTSGCALRSAANGRYVSAEILDPGAQKGMLRARSTSVGAWERFRISGDCSVSCALKSLANSKWVAAEKEYTGSGKGMLRARSKSIGTWEKFVFKPN